MKKSLIIIFVSLFGLAITAWFGSRWILSLSTADYSGQVTTNGISANVDIVFDEKGIPQIWAANNADMYFSLGWLHASERLFQMEFLRMLTYGELSATFGKEAFESDLLQRKLGFVRQAKHDMEELSPENRQIFESYCAGINAWIASKSILPPEFIVLDIKPRPWKPLDCLSIMLYQTWYAQSLMDADYKYNQFIESFGPDFVHMLKKYKTWSPPTVHDSFLKSLFANNRFPMRMSQASNSWVVAPDKSASGAALHAADPHLAVNRIPGFWYIAGLHSQTGANVLGITAPGLPFVMMGHNGKIAYAFTAAGVDVVDYYHEKRNPLDSMQVLTPSGFQNMHTITEIFRIKDEPAPRSAEIWMTSNGVVMEKNFNYVLSLRWAGSDFNLNEMVSSAVNLQNAGDFAAFQEAVTGLGAFNANWTYSDAKGNIGYQLGTPIPKRKFENSFIQLRAEDSKNQWCGYYSLKMTPSLLNPQEGWLASCNNQIVSGKWPYDIPGYYDPYRITRASALLKAKSKFNNDDFRKMQSDHISGIAQRWKELLIKGAAKINRPLLVQQVNIWNGDMRKDSYIAAVFTMWWEFLNLSLFEDDLGPGWQTGETVKEEVISNTYSTIIDNRNTFNVEETLVDISAQALEIALEKLDERTYGEISQLEIKHPLSGIKFLDTWLNLNRGPFPLEGDNGSLGVNQTIYNQQQNQFNTTNGASMRFVLDWADVDEFSIYTNPGQSGNPFSPHYDDFLDIWRQGGQWKVPFTKDKVFAKKTSIFQMVPAK